MGASLPGEVCRVIMGTLQGGGALGGGWESMGCAGSVTGSAENGHGAGVVKPVVCTVLKEVVCQRGRVLPTFVTVAGLVGLLTFTQINLLYVLLLLWKSR